MLENIKSRSFRCLLGARRSLAAGNFINELSVRRVHYSATNPANQYPSRQKTDENEPLKLCNLYKNVSFGNFKKRIYILSGFKMNFMHKMYKKFFRKKQNNKQKTA